MNIENAGKSGRLRVSAESMEPVKVSPSFLGKGGANSASVFHQEWWLKAASADAFSEVRVEEGGSVVARLPFVLSRRFGMTVIKMPPFTHILGPCVECGDGKYQTQINMRIKRTKQIIEQLPKFDYFFQIFDPSCYGGLALADGLAFQECGFRLGVQYTFRIDCARKIDDLFGELTLKSRQHIRNAQKYYKIDDCVDPCEFVEFYYKSLVARNLKSYMPLGRFINIYRECLARNCGQIVAAVDQSGLPVAMTFLVWDQRVMYYLLSVRAADVQDKGAVNFLIWSAITRANELGLVFDLDGVSTSGTAQFLSGFGGVLGERITVASARPIYATLQNIGRRCGFGNTSRYS